MSTFGVLKEASKLARELGLSATIRRADRAAVDVVLQRAAGVLGWLEARQVRLLPVDKRAADLQIVFGVVAEPGETDAHGDTIRAPVIASAAHGWLAKFQNRGLNHRALVNEQVQVFESYIAPVDLKIGGQKVKKGSWLLMYKILDADLWKKVRKGELTGFSLGGFGRRVKLRSENRVN